MGKVINKSSPEKQLSLFNTLVEHQQPRKSNVDEVNFWQTLEPIIDDFPNEDENVLPGIKWGHFTQLYTPAFWKLQYFLSDLSSHDTSHKLASNIIEEIVMCILGGYGIPSEMGIIAFNRLKEREIINNRVSFHDIYDALSSPFELESDKQVTYRFYNQKSRYIHKFLTRNDLDSIPEHNDLLLRNWLLSVDGVGLKTASWVTRNWLHSNNVAILDIHLLRAGKLTGFFESEILSDYLKLERQYLDFCSAISVKASDMDAIIWSFMKKNTKLAIKTLYS